MESKCSLPSIEQLRNETPGCKNVLHFNNAGASLPPYSVTAAVKAHLDLESHMGGYEAAEKNSQLCKEFYINAAQLIRCNPEEIAFTENATRAWDMAFYSLNLQAGDTIFTSTSEYASNYLAFLQKAKLNKIHIEVIANDPYGQIDLEQLRNKINDRVKLIALTHVPTQGGLINPAAEVGKIVKEFGITYLLDTTQSIGQMPIDVNQLNCDFLCATGRKYLRGPRGTGFLYAKQSKISQCEPPFIDLHSANWDSPNAYTLAMDAKCFETWEQNIAGKIGLSTAIQYALQLGIEPIWNRIKMLANSLRHNLNSLPGVEIHDQGQHQCGIVTFTCAQRSVQEVQNYLSSKRINTSISLQNYALLDLTARNLPALLRASVHYYNTEEEIEKVCTELKTFMNT